MDKSSWEGNCFLNFFNNKSSSGKVDKTIFKSKSTSPYKLLKSSYDQEGRCILPILHTAGGLVGGDLLVFEANIGINSKVLLTTSSAQKVYGSVGRSKINPKGTFSSQKTKINILENSHLEYLPQETIVFANGLYSQEFKIKISDNSSLLFTDLIRLGRSAAGETIENGVFRSKLEIIRNGKLSNNWEFVDLIELTKFSFEAKSGMDYMPVFGSLIWICEKEFPKTKISQLEENIKMIFKENDNYLSLGTLENGISIRFLGTSSQDARKCFFSIWTQIRTVCGFCKPEYQGVWPLQDL
ncbi:urease accessory protein UreD [Prochlorococcus sp. AH-716-E13]|nr:urease accessory protein UreD [Prochlorococcus sp. AH-716-E13]